MKEPPQAKLPPSRIVVIGGGLVGLATAYRLQQAYPQVQVTVVEKEDSVGRHQSGHNSGVLHCGLYYKPGSLKAKLAVEGIQQMVAFCQQHHIPHEVCGKLVIAASAEEVPRLRELHQRGAQNGLKGLQWMTPEQFREIEPHAAGVAALSVPQEGIVDYPVVARVLAQQIEQQGGSVKTRSEVIAIRREASRWLILTRSGEYPADLLINCAGLHSDRVAALSGCPPQVRIVPFRGEYYQIRKERQYLVKHLIYPVPDPKFPFLGVHFTRLIHGGIECGPNAVLALSREGYRKFDISLRDVWDALSYPGLWAFLRRYPRMCWEELRRSFSKRLFCESLQRLVPEIRPDDLEPGGAGVRAQAMSPTGELLQDFHFLAAAGALHVLNAPSPAATASLAIAQEITARAAKVFHDTGAQA
ncbi:MAG: L-2-hydroxyglutarate oxidase [Bryobacteraceae bacterium]|nr:L-2-hydroxyglutarate oxidase [Bryobacteraceae bacterium]MDW8377144.1 L-2-hydroxyglutarate oxidase [Bryobacterales bacterium]